MRCLASQDEVPVNAGDKVVVTGSSEEFAGSLACEFNHETFHLEPEWISATPPGLPELSASHAVARSLPSRLPCTAFPCLACSPTYR